MTPQDWAIATCALILVLALLAELCKKEPEYLEDYYCPKCGGAMYLEHLHSVNDEPVPCCESCDWHE
jgi:hypothetical protein